MNLYTMVASGIGSGEAAALSTRLAAWHDAMVAHERKLRSGRTDGPCDEDCPHAEADLLWREALETLGERAYDLTFLRTRAVVRQRAKPFARASGHVAAAPLEL